MDSLGLGFARKYWYVVFEPERVHSFVGMDILGLFAIFRPEHIVRKLDRSKYRYLAGVGRNPF
jgi:hypothetical protein